MSRLLDAGHDEPALERYGALQSRFQEAGGYSIDADLEGELDALDIGPRLRGRRFDLLSGGEQTCCLLAGLFARQTGFPLIDEPTNHLDRPVESMSPGQQKKVELAGSFVASADLLLWDEPLNFLDIDAREAIEDVVLRDTPTLVFVEHDAAFEAGIANAGSMLRQFRGDSANRGTPLPGILPKATI